MLTKQILANSVRCLFKSAKQFNEYSTKQLSWSEIRTKRSYLFDCEKERQLSLISRVEKIQVVYKGPPEDCMLYMNKNLSTPYNCAMHLQELLTTQSVVALVDGKPWDMHRPLTGDCELKFTHFKDSNPMLANNVFWRSCSFILGLVLENAFKEDCKIQLHSFPSPNIRSGSFVYNAIMDVGDWKPSTMELQMMSKIAAKLAYQDLRFERLTVDASFAKRIFQDNPNKLEQIPSVAAASADSSSVVIYRLGNHVDISKGPMMGSTWLLSRFDVTAIHDIKDAGIKNFKRVQGVAMPKQIPVHYYTYNYLVNRAAKVNKNAYYPVREYA